MSILKIQKHRWSYSLTCVDSLIVFCEDKRSRSKIVRNLNKEIEVKELGEVSFFLGIQIETEEYRTYLLN